ncbi:IclR family transcriptional regulator [Microbacterium sp. 22242]|uniref:IclR family transcriptional regulator n=1 Tax=Microbacterium sp. 22242 TaxID=3453896 RepID=UPI003F84E9EC
MHDVTPRRVSRNLTADRTLHVLGLFTESRSVITIDDVVVDLGISRATAYRYMQSLVRERYLESTPDGSLRLGAKVFDLARSARREYTLSALATPAMRALAAKYNQVVLLTTLIDDEVVCLEREGWQTHLTYEPGVRLPVNAGASALVLLAWKPPEELDALLRRPLGYFNRRSIVDKSLLRDALSRIRSDESAVTVSDVDEDAVGVAVPVMSGGQVIAGLSLVSPVSRLAAVDLSGIRGDLRQAATAVAGKHQLAHTL